MYTYMEGMFHFKVLMRGEIDPLSKNNKEALIVLCSATAKSYVGKCWALEE